jgi:hypothetical protein
MCGLAFVLSLRSSQWQGSRALGAALLLLA